MSDHELQEYARTLEIRIEQLNAKLDALAESLHELSAQIESAWDTASSLAEAVRQETYS